MNLQVSSLVVLLCLVSANCADLAEVASLIARIKISLREGGLKLDETRRTIGINVETSQGAINGQLRDLDKILNDSETLAEEQGKDIRNCLGQCDERLQALDLRLVQQCRRNPQLDEVGKKLKALGNEIKILNDAVTSCQEQSPDNVGGCLEGTISNVEKEIEGVEDEIEETCAGVAKSARECIKQNSEVLSKDITEISGDFQRCIEGILQ